MTRVFRFSIGIFAVCIAVLLAFQNCSPRDFEAAHNPSVYDPATNPDKIESGDMLLDRSAITSKGDPSSTGGFDQAASGLPVYYAKTWPNGKVPVQFDPTISLTNRQSWLSACATWAPYTSIKCVTRTTEADYVYVTDDDTTRCYTDVGAYSGATPSYYQKRVFNFGQSWCWDSVSVLHELGHVLGLMHEHQRPDRDSYIQIVTANILPGYSFAFTKFSSVGTRSAYDYLSIMHYHPWSYSIASDRSKPTIIGANGYTGQIGQATTLSLRDKSVIRQMYPVVAY